MQNVHNLFATAMPGPSRHASPNQGGGSSAAGSSQSGDGQAGATAHSPNALAPEDFASVLLGQDAAPNAHPAEAEAADARVTEDPQIPAQADSPSTLPPLAADQVPDIKDASAQPDPAPETAPPGEIGSDIAGLAPPPLPTQPRKHEAPTPEPTAPPPAVMHEAEYALRIGFSETVARPTGAAGNEQREHTLPATRLPAGQQPTPPQLPEETTLSIPAVAPARPEDTEIVRTPPDSSSGHGLTHGPTKNHREAGAHILTEVNAAHRIVASLAEFGENGIQDASAPRISASPGGGNPTLSAPQETVLPAASAAISPGQPVAEPPRTAAGTASSLSRLRSEKATPSATPEPALSADPEGSPPVSKHAVQPAPSGAGVVLQTDHIPGESHEQQSQPYRTGKYDNSAGPVSSDLPKPQFTSTPARSVAAQPLTPPLGAEGPTLPLSDELAQQSGIPAALHPTAGREVPPHLQPPARPDLPAHVPVQISQAIGNATGPVTEITLAPEELGNLRIEVSTEGDRVSLTLLAERPDTLDLLRRHADRLIAEFRAAGFSEMNLGFGNLGSREGASEHHPAGPPDHNSGTASDPEVAIGSVPDTRQHALRGSALYLRL